MLRMNSPSRTPPTMQTLKSLGPVSANSKKEIDRLIRAVASRNPKIKFGSSRKLLEISKQNPSELFANLDFFEKLLESDNNILKWNAIDIISNIACADPRKLSQQLFRKLLQLLSDSESMITAAHVVDNVGRIAKAAPRLEKTITANLMKLEHSERNSECREIILGKTIVAFKQYFGKINDKDLVVGFVERRLRSTRHATRAKAEVFLKAVAKLTCVAG